MKRCYVFLRPYGTLDVVWCHVSEVAFLNEIGFGRVIGEGSNRATAIANAMSF
jgi:hypothetical protein